MLDRNKSKNYNGKDVIRMIGILTYNVPHRKTYDTLCLLKAKGYKDVVVCAQPMHYVKKFVPLYEHRPKNMNDISPKQLCDNFGFKYECEKRIDEVLPYNSIVLVCGAGIIPESIVQNYQIINSHPGYIPNVRGLDALKWAIIEEQPIGVTTHRIGEYVDAGLTIERKIVPVYYNDTFHSVAQRQYEMEILMLVDAIEKIDNATEYILPGEFELHKRMPPKYEELLLAKFEELKKKNAVQNQ